MQKSSLTDYIAVFDNALPDELCDQLIAEFNRHTEQQVSRDTDLYQFNVINCNQAGDDWRDIAQHIAITAGAKAEQYFASLGLGVTPEIEAFESVRLKRYDLGDEFKEHVDVADYASARRYLICLIYLDDNEGGETEFPGLGIRVPCVKGRLVVFPPTWMFPHAGRPPIGKPKYTIATSLHYL